MFPHFKSIVSLFSLLDQDKDQVERFNFQMDSSSINSLMDILSNNSNKVLFRVCLRVTKSFSDSGFGKQKWRWLVNLVNRVGWFFLFIYSVRRNWYLDLRGFYSRGFIMKMSSFCNLTWPELPSMWPLITPGSFEVNSGSNDFIWYHDLHFSMNHIH